jgi:hypothetical protein
VASRITAEDADTPRGTPAAGGELRIAGPVAPVVAEGGGHDLSSDDQRNLITVVLAGIQREIAVAESHYLRGRSFITMAGTLFVAAQAAFIAMLGRTAASTRSALIDAGERGTVIYVAAGAAVALLIAVVVLIVALDRGRDVSVFGSRSYDAFWDDGHAKSEPMTSYLTDTLVGEIDNWTTSNTSRRRAGYVVAVFAALSVAVSLAQFVLVYHFSM